MPPVSRANRKTFKQWYNSNSVGEIFIGPIVQSLRVNEVDEVKEKEVELPMEQTEEEEDKAEKQEFLEMVKQSNVMLNGIIAHDRYRVFRQKMMLNLGREFDERQLLKSSQPQDDKPSTSEYIFKERAEGDETPHKYAQFFPPDFTWDMVDFITDPINRNGIPFDPEKMEKYSYEKDDQETRKRITKQVEQDNLEDAIMKLVIEEGEVSSDEGVASDRETSEE